MKKMFQMLSVFLLIALMFGGSSAFAVNHDLEPFSVYSTSPKYVTSAKKSDNEQRWYVTLTKASYTTDDTLYLNVRNKVNGTRLSNALSFKAVTKKSTKYTTKTNKGQSIFLHTQLKTSTWTPDSFWNISKGIWCP